MLFYAFAGVLRGWRFNAVSDVCVNAQMREGAADVFVSLRNASLNETAVAAPEVGAAHGDAQNQTAHTTFPTIECFNLFTRLAPGLRSDWC